MFLRRKSSALICVISFIGYSSGVDGITLAELMIGRGIYLCFNLFRV